MVEYGSLVAKGAGARLSGWGSSINAQLGDYGWLVAAAAVGVVLVGIMLMGRRR